MIDIESRVRQLADSDVPLADVVQELRRLRDEGADKEVVYTCLERFREEAGTKEDRVLEIMDCVVGFCSPHMRVW